MNEREIFEKAIEIQDPVQRQAFLDQACGGDATLRARLDELLASPQQAGQFPNVPRADPISPPAQERVQQTIELSPSSGATVGGETFPPHSDDEDDESHPVADLSFLQPPTKPGSIGTLGHYVILQVLGQGAFGIVFKAFDEKLHRHVAIKAMNPQLAATSPPRKRFVREARSVAAIKHENIVQVYSVEEQPLPYLVMEYVDGQTLQQKLNGAGPLDVPEILHLGRQMAVGLAAAHEKGLIHRDIKPGNILLEAGAEQKVKITDFGLARAADDATMTRTGAIAGTPMYMAPEQAMGQTLDHRADLFSLGSVLYQMTCGRAPFRGAHAMAVLKRVVDETPRPIQDILPEAPDWLCTIIQKLHAKNPDERFQTARELADLLAKCQNELQVNGKVTCVVAPPQHGAPANGSPSAPSSSQSTVDSNAERDRALAGRAKLPGRTGRKVGLLLGGLATCILFGAIIINITNKDGTKTKIEVPAESKVEVTDSAAGDPPAKKTDTAKKTDSPSQPLVANPAPPSSETVVTNVRPQLPPWQLPKGSPPPALAPFSAEKAKEYQDRWAGHLQRKAVETNTLGMKFALIPPGEFVLPVSTRAPVMPEQDLKLRRKVRLTSPYFIGTTEVTVDQFRQFVEAAGYRTQAEPAPPADKQPAVNAPPSWRNPGRYKPAPDEPVTMVSLVDARAFCRWLGKQDGRTYRLPTEAEWEFASLAGGTSVPGGAVGRKDLPNFGWLNPKEATEANPQTPFHPVGQKQVNAFGLFDVVGSVFEWCADGEDGADLTRLAAINPRSTVGHALHSVVFVEEQAWEPGIRQLHEKQFFHWGVGFRVVQDVPTQSLEAEVEPDRPLAQSGPIDPSIPVLPPWKLPPGAPPPAVVPFSAAKARQHQQRWAKYVSQEVFATNSLGMKLALIPAGECDFALTKDGQEKVDSSTPQAKVRITQPFYLATTEVSVAQFRKFVESTSYQTDAERNGTGMGLNLQTGGEWRKNVDRNWKTPGWEPKDDEPVVQVSHDDALAFSEWLSKVEKVRYRLAYDAEWVFACRAGSLNKSGLDVGEDALADWIWAGQPTWFKPGASPSLLVNSLEVNPFGLHHMHGNVHEWCVQSVEAWTSSKMAQSVVHGWAWTAAGRMDISIPDVRWREFHDASAHVGFRIVRELPVVAGLTPAKATGPVLVRLGSQPLSPRAFVSRPVPIPGLRSWTIEPAGMRAGSNFLAAISPDGKHVATVGGGDPTIRISNDRFELEQMLLGHEWASIADLKFSPDGRFLASSEVTGQNGPAHLKIWDVTNSRLLWNVAFQGVSIAWSSDSRRIALGRGGDWGWSDIAPAVLEVADGRMQMLEGTAIGAGASRVSWSASGDRLLCALQRGDYSTNPPTTLRHMRLYDGKTLKLLKEHELPKDVDVPREMSWSPRGDRALLSNGARLWLWDVELGTTQPGPEISTDGLSAVWLPDGEGLIISGVKDADVTKQGTILWDLHKNERVRTISPAVGRAAWIDNGRQLAIFDGSNLLLFDAETWTEQHQTQRGVRGVVDWSPSALSPDGKRLACNSGGQLTFWDAGTGEFQQRILNFPFMAGLTWSPKGDQLAVWQNEVLLIDAASGERRISLKGHSSGLYAVAWSPDGDQLTTASSDKTAKLWDAKTGECRHTLTHVAPVLGVAWSPSGKLVATVTETALQIWDAGSGASVGKVDPLPGNVAVHGSSLFSSPNPLSWGLDDDTLYVGFINNSPFRVLWRSSVVSSVTGGFQYLNFLSVSPNKEWAMAGDGVQSYLISLGRLQESRQALYTAPGGWHPDSRRFISGANNALPLQGFDAPRFERLGTLLPRIGGEQFVCIGPDGHYRGSRRIDEHLVYVALHDDGSQRTYSPQAFREKFQWKNDPKQARFLKLLPEHETPPPAPVPQPPVIVGRSLDEGLNLAFAGQPPEVIPAAAAAIEPGQPVSPRAVVAQPISIPGLRSWSIETAGHRGSATVISPHPSGALVASGGGEDGSIRLWDRSGSLRRVLLGHTAERNTGAVLGLAWSPDGRWLASTGADRTLRIWDAQSGRMQQLYPLPLRGEHLVWAPSGTSLGVVGQGWAVVDLATRKIITRPDAGTCLAAWWSAEAGLFTVLQNDGVARCYDLESSVVDNELRLADMQSPVVAAVSADGRHIAALHQADTRRLAVWEIATGKLVKSSDEVQIGYRLSWSSDGSIAVVGNRLRVWDGLTLQERFGSIPLGGGDQNAVAWSPDGQTVIVSQSGRIRFFDRDGGLLVGGSPEAGRLPKTAFGNGLEINSDGATVWTRGSGPLQSWNVRSSDLQGPAFACDGNEFRISPNGQRMAVAGSGVYVRDATTGAEQLKLTDGTPMVDVDWSSDSQRIAVVRANGKVEIRNATTGDVAREFADDRGACNGVKWSPDGRWLAATGSAAATLRVWDAETGDVCWNADGIRGRTMPGNSCDWSPDSKELAYSKQDGSIVRVDANTGEARGPVLPPRQSWIDLRYSPDGRFLAVSENDAIAVIELATGKETRLPYSGPLRWVPKTNLLLAGSWTFSQIVVHDVATGRPDATLFTQLPNNQRVCIGPTGHYRGSLGVEDQIVYVAMLDDGSQHTYTPAEFAEKFGWKNDPEKATLLQLTP